MITYKSAQKFSNKMFNNITYQKKKRFNNIDRRNENKNERTQ